MLSFSTLVWGGFLLLITLIIALDLGVFHRKSHVVSLPEALGWTTVWIVLALIFNVGVYYLYELNPAGWDIDTARLTGAQAALQFFTGYVVEYSLSIDNVFVIAMVLSYFRVPLAQQHRVLFWGIFGALVLRGLMIGLGVLLIEKFSWITYVFGGLLIYSAARMLVIQHDSLNPDANLFVRAFKRFYPVTTEFHGRHFFVTVDGVRMATPLFMALLMVEASDVAFAIDSIPAIFAITTDPFIVFTSNVFAVLGLRSLYFVLAGLMEKFRYLKISLVFLLAYIGVKMLLVHHYPISNEVSLAVIAGIVAVGIIASMAVSRDSEKLLSPLAGDTERLLRVTYRQAQNAVILIIGSSIFAIGVAMLVLPGPALVVIPLGLAVLAVEFVWAHRWLGRVKRELLDVQARINNGQ
ncbi:MAG TPA: TerC/Alx family metal homeostasis membrane protein [Woeseiaceae bacterium]|nr:TerC/Alx family metal homeostasis membrane protein [Woeseiaceae bacterium]